MTWSVISHIHPWPGQWYHTSAHDLVSDITSSHDLVSDITSSHDLVSDITHPAMTWSVIPYIQSALTLCLIFQWWGFQSCAGALNLVSVPQGQDWMANSISQLCVEAFAQIQSVLKTDYLKSTAVENHCQNSTFHSHPHEGHALACGLWLYFHTETSLCKSI